MSPPSPASSAIDSEKSPESPKSEVEKCLEGEFNEKQVNSTYDDDGKKAGIEAYVPDIIPNGGYGWVCVGTCFVINAHTWGMNSVSQASRFARLR